MLLISSSLSVSLHPGGDKNMLFPQNPEQSSHQLEHSHHQSLFISIETVFCDNFNFPFFGHIPGSLLRGRWTWAGGVSLKCWLGLHPPLTFGKCQNDSQRESLLDKWIKKLQSGDNYRGNNLNKWVGKQYKCRCSLHMEQLSNYPITLYCVKMLSSPSSFWIVWQDG